ncbi:MAG TPA: hypothetical protein VGQ16_07590 [Vicinamibacterales bacterium]|jgi:hypothetical protein|nr:hypothetical protein [Vicinamibacterales bacterium]
MTLVALRHFVAATGLVALIAYVAVYSDAEGDAPIHSDGYSYYVYLPATLIYKDVSLDALAREWYGGTYPGFTGIRRWPSTGRWMNLHPIGVAILMTPFFLAADLLSGWSNLPRDGFSLYYQHAAALAGIVYLLAGLALLFRMLSRHFSPGVVLATLTCITFGTNLFHYGVFDGVFSHVFSFFLVAVWLFLVERWWERPSVGDSVRLGIAAALIVLTRHTDAIVLLVLPLYGVTRVSDLRARIGELWRRRRPLLVATMVGATGLVPQLALYRWTTGTWFPNPYGTFDVGFNWGSPRIVSVLFSTQKGLFFWSPLLLLTLIGAVVAEGWTRRLVLATSVVFALETYLVACWWDWQLGASYGHRAFTDGLALAAPFLATTFEWAAARPLARRLVSGIAVAAVLLSIVQMIQYWNGIMPNADTTWAQYRAQFLRLR